jgi:hypothetical protein
MARGAAAAAASAAAVVVCLNWGAGCRCQSQWAYPQMSPCCCRQLADREVRNNRSRRRH